MTNDSELIDARISALEEKLASKQSELDQIATQFDLFFNQFLDSIIVVDASSGIIVEANESAFRFLKYRRDELVSSKFHVLFPVPEADRDRKQIIKKLQVHGHAFAEQWFLRHDGETVTADLSAVMVTWRDRNAILIVLRDSAERKKFERHIRETEVIKGRLNIIAQLSHEINNPLQELVSRMDLNGDDRYREPMQRIENVMRKLREQAPLSKEQQEDKAVEIEDEAKPLEPCKANTILVVDDEPAIRGLLKTVLERRLSGITIDIASSGKEALKLFKEVHHQLLVMDVSMPEMRGDEAFLHTMEICKEWHWESPAVIFCTGYNMPPTVRVTVERDPKHLCLLKPVNLERIVDVVKDRISGQ